MKTIRNLLLGTVLAGLAASPALAESGSINAQITVAQTIGITEAAPIDFGLIGGTIGGNEGCDIAPDGSVTCSNPAITHFGGQAAGQLDLTGSPNATLLVEIDSGVTDGTVDFNGPLCQNGGAAAQCGVGNNFTTVLDGSGATSLAVGGAIRFLFPAPVAAVYALAVPVTVSYQ